MLNDDILWKKVESIKQRTALPKTSGSVVHKESPNPSQKRTNNGSVVQAQQDTKKPRRHATTQPPTHETVIPRYYETMTPSATEIVRKAVKQIGKEAATHRFRPEEKQAIADIVYTYARQGYKTTENEITRIAVNWLILDYQGNGKRSILHKILTILKE